MSAQDMDNGGEDFSQDVTTEQNFQSQQDVNGGGDAPHADSGSADMPGKDDDRKLFVGGLSWETTHKELRDYFGKYGDIESINVKTDPNTGRSRGFAFIVFAEAAAIDKVVAAGTHLINNKRVDPKKAKARHGKIFIGGISTDLTESDIREYFEQYGKIIEIEMPFDKQKNQRKNFCFVTFESELVVQELLKSPKQTIKDKEVDVKKATPKADQMMGGGGWGRGGGGGGGAGGRMRGGAGGRGGRGGSYGGTGGYGANWSQGYGGYGSNGYSYGGYGSQDGYDYYGGYSSYPGYDYSSYGSGGSYGAGGGGSSGKAQRGGAAGRSSQRHQPY